MTPTISEMVARYDMADGQFITLRHRDGKVHITAANMMVETGDEVKAIIADFKSRVASPREEPVKVASKPRPAKKTAKDGRRLWTDEEKAEIIRRYQAGEGPKAIGDSLGVNRNTIQQIIHAAGVTEGRTGQNLRKKKEEPQPEADENEPV